MKTNFTTIYRNYGHWDIVTQDRGRIFRIRGTPGNFVAMDEREKPYPVTRGFKTVGVTRGFKTVGACMAFIADELMFEQLIEDRSSPGNNKPLEAQP